MPARGPNPCIPAHSTFFSRALPGGKYFLVGPFAHPHACGAPCHYEPGLHVSRCSLTGSWVCIARSSPFSLTATSARGFHGSWLQPLSPRFLLDTRTTSP